MTFTAEELEDFLESVGGQKIIMWSVIVHTGLTYLMNSATTGGARRTLRDRENAAATLHVFSKGVHSFFGDAGILPMSKGFPTGPLGDCCCCFCCLLATSVQLCHTGVEDSICTPLVSKLEQNERFFVGPALPSP